MIFQSTMHKLLLHKMTSIIIYIYVCMYIDYIDLYIDLHIGIFMFGLYMSFTSAKIKPSNLKLF